MEEIKQIGNSSLYVITSVEDMNRSQGRMIWLFSKLLWFKIAHLDENKKIIGGKVLTFEGENASQVADFISGALTDLVERSYVGSIQMGNSNVKVVRSDMGALIQNDTGSVEVAQENIDKLAHELGYVAVVTNVR